MCEEGRMAALEMVAVPKELSPSPVALCLLQDLYS